MVVQLSTFSIELLDYNPASAYDREKQMKRVASWALLLALPLLGQEGHLEGRVTGSGAKAVPDAVVIVSRVDTAWKRSILTNKQGHFSLEQLPPGLYRVQAVKPQFKPASEELVEVRMGQPASVTLRMPAERDSAVSSAEYLTTSQP